MQLPCLNEKNCRVSQIKLEARAIAAFFARHGRNCGAHHEKRGAPQPVLTFETRNRCRPVSIYDIKYRESVPKCNRKVRDFAWRHRSCAISAVVRFFARSYGCGLAGGTGHAPPLVFGMEARSMQQGGPRIMRCPFCDTAFTVQSEKQVGTGEMQNSGSLKGRRESGDGLPEVLRVSCG